ncbi:hypothetical protein A3H38_05825 [candidate division WOR-1 bacterium RIFCSPLOWO2_02_FULL_46_20]|uniref:acylphosphatase n=1 Tax=candidate division WOR-1 bacterium RIFCSPLOWO2_02_FULL_46_20 TaxID=1802567 RepID=A0A1F4RBC4_UNCSA|nr:MAG: hypothetical protein A3J44_04545 [candidate division WOR-1 bacterium RIFCSPHIGHO2_02_FULL_45_12]OGC05482.1 MAG: hypothetical protein A3H38_05825 [candidate division WOR-1 bacterium RIFCSPLOWO2_02_FULL_46_20]
MKRVHIYYFGNVQGVGFRYTSVIVAKRYGLNGWVKNCADSRVELVAEGKEAALKEFLAELEKSMSHHISDKKINWEPATGEFNCFQTVY